MATKIKTVKIHPAIGIARLGNSPTKFFIGPEKPGLHRRPNGGYRDAKGRIKRQAARFRLFGYDKKGKLVKEITSADAKIEWTVHLANTKAAWKRFVGLNPSSALRNASVTNRYSLVIDPGPRSLSGPNKVAIFDTGTFLGVIVPLGEIRTDKQARLLVLGGFGNSGSPNNAPITHWANNEGWHDDVSDGPVNATVTFKGETKSIQAVAAWLICGPPKFAPPIDNIITLYDTLLQVAVDKLGFTLPAKPSFAKDIYPILLRAINVKWVNQLKKMEEDNMPPPPPPNDKGHADAVWGKIIPPPGSVAARKFIFDKLRDPALQPNQSSGESDMPMIFSDTYDTTRKINQALTKTQYNIMKKWKDGNFVKDWSGPPKPSKQITPAGLDRAALESCVGAAFYPGIEASWMLRDTYTYLEPFRLDQTKLEPGDVTKQMAVPWQTDFYDCRFYEDEPLAWWPAQRPDDVFPMGSALQVEWTRDLVKNPTDMIKKWHRLGFVVKKGNKFVETERKP
jgi:hypothetical protein